jgi:two-component system nitrate/nitrite response regulator NarL
VVIPDSGTRVAGLHDLDRPSQPPGSAGAAGPDRVAIVEDHGLFAEALEVALGLEHHEVYRVPLADHTMTTGQLLTAVLRSDPGLVLLDLDLGAAGNGMRLVTPLTEAGVPVVVFTGNIDPARWGECLALGAVTVLPKTTPLATMLDTLRQIADDQPVLEPDVRDAWLTAYQQEEERSHATRDRLDSLTTREREVLAHLMAGHQVRDIAKSSSVAETTVRSQVKAILAKLNVTSQIGAVGAAYHAQWRPPVVPATPEFTDMRDAARALHP